MDITTGHVILVSFYLLNFVFKNLNCQKLCEIKTKNNLIEKDETKESIKNILILYLFISLF